MRAISGLMASLTALTDSSVRQGIRKTAETPPRVSIIDVVALVAEQSHQQAAHTFQRLQEAFPEVCTSMTHFRFSGRGQRDTPVIDARGIIEIIMVIPGRCAAGVRKNAASVVCRYLGGDLDLVKEIAANRLSQEEMGEDDPARIFGQTVESDIIKRKREEVTLAELDLQIVEQAGALKRRKIESIQYCLEALENIGGCDDRSRVRSADMVRTVAFGSTADPQSDKEICIREVINAAGRSKEGLDCKVGKLAKKLLLVDHPTFVFPKKQIYANGQLIEANMWLDSQRVYIERALASL